MPQGIQPRNQNWLPYFGLALSIGGIVYQGGALTQQVRDAQTRITKLESANAVLVDKLSAMDIRGIKNEQKLDFLVDRAQEIEGRRR